MNDELCEECGHPIDRHNGANGCTVDLGDSEIDGCTVALGECGCKNWEHGEK